MLNKLELFNNYHQKTNKFHNPAIVLTGNSLAWINGILVVAKRVFATNFRSSSSSVKAICKCLGVILRFLCIWQVKPANKAISPTRY